MKKLFFLFTLSLLLVSVAWGQGLEDFTNSNATASYLDGTFIGNDGITWSYGHSRNEDVYPIDGKGLMLQRASDSYLEATIPGGIATFSFEYRKAYTGSSARQLELIINENQVATSTVFGSNNGADNTVYTFSVPNVNVAGDVTVKIKNVGTTSTKRQTVIDNISWTGYASSTPTISVNPTTLSGFTYILGNGPSTEQSFVVSGINLTDDVTISLPTNYEISDDTGENFQAAINPIILTQTAGEVNQTIYVRLKAGLVGGIYSDDISLTSTDAADQTLSLSGLVEVPAYTALPYGETFDADLGDIYTHSVLGDTKVWDWDTYSGNGFAKMSGYDYSNEAVAEEDWLILPGIDMSVYANAAVSFDTAWSYGTDDADNYLKFMYSSNYTGLGNPNDATWVEIPFTQPSSGNYSWQSSGTIVLDDLPDETVFFAFKYGGTASNYRTWEIDNIIIDENLSPILSVTPSALEGFSYDHNHGPSAEQSFVVSGANLTDNISINAPANYEISVSSESGYIPAIVLNHTDGTVDETTIYTRLKAGLAIDTYNEDISVTSTNAAPQAVNCDGEVSAPPAPEAPEALAATDVGSDSFTAKWNAVDGATGYNLDVYTLSSTPASDLFISEYIEGSSYNKAIEIYNGTGGDVNLSVYSLKKQTNGAGEFGNELLLDGILAAGDVYITAYEATTNAADAAILALADNTNSSVTNFNGNDAIALFKSDTMIDVVGLIGDTSNWGIDVTLVRQADASVPSTTYSADDWDQYPQNTFEYLGSHNFSGLTKTFVTGFENLDVSDVLNYEVTDLDPGTTYYYVVRAYHDYGVSTDSNEIEVTTAAATEDYPQGDPIPVGDDTITFTQGSANEGPAVGDLPAWNNASLDPGSVTTLSFSLIGDGPWTITIETDALYGAVYYDGDWHAFENVDGVVTIEIPSLAGKGPDVIVVLGEEDPTLPVELSSFTAVMNSDNHAVISWVTQTETGVSGYYVLRNSVEDLET
ncbi:MAG: lamin tail domain-containing protein, partial [Candidatus ainarchaeum sp.]|nr:lamin tail domain-containing protein [Candidatus ainarchaeum sp.]